MKTLNKIFLVSMTFAALVATVSLSSCGGDDGPTLTEEQKVTKILTDNGGKWTPPPIAGVTVDGLDVTADLFKDFTITFGEGTLTTTGTSPVWLRSDTWSFKDETATVMIRGQDGKEITIKEITEGEMVLSLEWDQETFEPGGGRSRSIKGTHEFVLTK